VNGNVFWVPLILAIISSNGIAAGPKLVGHGPDGSRGVLVNLTLGSRGNAPIDPSRRTVVVVHGLNPFHPFMHFTMAERYAEAIANRYAGTVNVLGWDWNADTMPSLHPSINDRHAVKQGLALAQCLRNAGVRPETLHMIGQSSGSLVVASAARELTNQFGYPINRLTLLDPVTDQHAILFDELAVGSSAVTIEHIWVPGLSGFGKHAEYSNITNQPHPGPYKIFGLIRPLHSDHLHAVKWHIGQM
jgi:hypothetical protein